MRNNRRSAENGAGTGETGRSARVQRDRINACLEEVFSCCHLAQACRLPGIDVEIFYPVTEDDADAAEAKAICEDCPVRHACLEHALANREREGVWAVPRARAAPHRPPAPQVGLTSGAPLGCR